MDVDKSAALLEGILDTLRQIQDELRARPKIVGPEQKRECDDSIPEELEALASSVIGAVNVKPSELERHQPSAEPECENPVVNISIGSLCIRTGCGFQYSGLNSELGKCLFHPKSPSFSDGFWIYACCNKVANLWTATASGFMEGCQTKNSHLFDVGDNDHHQRNTASFIQHSSLIPLPDEVEQLRYDVPGLIQSPGISLPSFKTSTNRQALCTPLEKRDSLDIIEHSAAWHTETTAKKIDTVPFQDWITPLRQSPLLANKLLQHEFGDAWMIPDDGRMPLTFCRQSLELLSPELLNGRIESLKAFRDQMKKDIFDDFKVIDDFSDGISGARSQATYRLGRQTRTAGACRIPLAGETTSLQPRDYVRVQGDDVQDGPWRRFVYCQGLATTSNSFQNPTNSWAAPFVSRGPTSRNWSSRNWYSHISAIRDHLNCKRRSPDFYNPAQETSNPYSSPSKAFHITFYEVLQPWSAKHEKFRKRGRWNHGPLYDGFQDQLLCESALTMIEIPADAAQANRALRKADSAVPLDAVDYWTVLLLSPPLFYPRRSSNPLSMTDPLHILCLEILATVYGKVFGRWARLQRHLEMLLNERRAIMDPTEHDELLWDDETFSRSRKYFWAIQCLTEFQISINDNILQWEMYYSARIKPYHDADMLSGHCLTDLEDIETNCTGLRTIRSYFVDQLESTKALRDGLFNASAVVESRASTRLGENVKLLTFVSIFFLPLAFCTSLWSVNETYSRTILIYTSFIVAIFTYALVFNLNNIVAQGSKAYRPLREGLLNGMKTTGKDTFSFWPRTGRRFDDFKPRHEKGQPSEWWIVIFFFKTIWNFASKITRKGDKSHTKEGSSSSGWSEVESSSSSRRSSLASEPLNMPVEAEMPADDVPGSVVVEESKGAESELEAGSKPNVTTTNDGIAGQILVDGLQENFVTLSENTPAQDRQHALTTAPQVGAVTNVASADSPRSSVEQQVQRSRPKNQNIVERAWTRVFRRKTRKSDGSNGGDTV